MNKRIGKHIYVLKQKRGKTARQQGSGKLREEAKTWKEGKRFRNDDRLGKTDEQFLTNHTSRSAPHSSTNNLHAQ